MPTRARRNLNDAQFGTATIVHLTEAATLTPAQRVVGVAGAGGAFTVTLADSATMDGLDVYIFREDATNTVTVAPPTGDAAFITAQAITAIATGFTHLKAMNGRWTVLDSKLS